MECVAVKLDKKKIDEGKGTMEIRDLITASGALYGIDQLNQGKYQYMDREYCFNYVPDELKDSLHIKTCGHDKLIRETDICFSLQCDSDIEVYVLYADKFPMLPK